MFRRLSVWLVFLILGVNVPDLVAQTGDISTLVEGFNKSYQWCERVAMSGCVTAKWNNKPDLYMESHFVFFNDGWQRTKRVGKWSYTDVKTGAEKEKNNEFLVPDIIQTLYTSDATSHLFYDYRGITGRHQQSKALVYKDGESRAKIARAIQDTGAPALGYFSPFSRRRISEFFDNTPASLREDEVNGVHCQVIETEIPEGYVTAWIAPELGYTLQKCVLIKEAGKHVDTDGDPFGHINPSMGEPLAVKRMIYELTNVQVENIDGVFVPASGQYTYTEELEGGKANTGTFTFAFSDVDLNPQFEANSFAFAVPEGTRVEYILENRRNVGGFKWADGRIVADVDENDTTTIENTVVAIREGNVTPREAALTLDSPKPSQEQRLPISQETRRYLWLLLAAAILLAGGILLRYRADRAAKS